ncbi:hypothetical protein KM043_010541 [Ampulex compressa]|nr:hypothetical protein KM043_010541 [Ampulex compressa]
MRTSEHEEFRIRFDSSPTRATENERPWDREHEKFEEDGRRRERAALSRGFFVGGDGGILALVPASSTATHPARISVSRYRRLEAEFSRLLLVPLLTPQFIARTPDYLDFHPIFLAVSAFLSFMNPHRCRGTIVGKSRTGDVIASRRLASDWLADDITW